MQDTSLKVLQYATLCIVLGALTAIAHAQSQGSWTTKTPIPLAAQSSDARGSRRQSPRDRRQIQNVAGTYHDEYDPATDRWRTRARCRTGSTIFGAAVLNARSTQWAASCLRP